jgi:proteasome lid subunit RPN8/RPN11
MPPLRVSRTLVDDVLGTIVTCGGGRRECIVYVTARVDDARRADGFIHPGHSATPTSTEVVGDELDRVWDLLRKRSEQIVLQVHSHPGAAHHSGIDDRWPVLHRVGFPSLVVARFGRDRLAGAHVAVYLGGGDWQDLVPGTWHEHLLIDQLDGHDRGDA